MLHRTNRNAHGSVWRDLPLQGCFSFPSWMTTEGILTEFANSIPKNSAAAAISRKCTVLELLVCPDWFALPVLRELGRAAPRRVKAPKRGPEEATETLA